MPDHTITISPADIAAKRREVEEHELAAKRGREWIRAAEILIGAARPQPAEAILTGLDEHIAAMDAAAETPDPKDLTAAIEGIARESAEPITKANLKERLRAAGFPEDRLSNYFYTAVMRLKRRERIQVLSDGRVWRPQS